jgi:GNAT superfamily N-acetyltransferase
MPSPGVAELHIFALSPNQLGGLLEMLRRCSRSSLVHRFHGVTDGTDHVRQLVATQGHGHESLSAWSGGRCVGLATLGDHELGILVEDRWQRRGVGTALVDRLVASARARGFDHLVANVLGEDRFVLEVLRRIGPIEATLEWGVYTVVVSLPPMLGPTHDA